MTYTPRDLWGDRPCEDYLVGTTWRRSSGSKLHALRLEGPRQYSLACNSKYRISEDEGEHMDYRYTEWGHCRKKGCAAFFEASSAGRLG